MNEKPRTPEELAKAAPINFGPGSYELSDLEAASKKIVAAKPEERAAVEAAELAAVNQRIDEPDSNLLPGHVLVEREQVLVEGTKVKGEKDPVGEVKVTEQIQVFDPAKAAEEEAAAEEVTAGVDVAGTGNGAAAAPAAGAAAKD